MNPTEMRYAELARVQELYHRVFSDVETHEWLDAVEKMDPRFLHEAVTQMIRTDDFPSISRLIRHYNELAPALPSGYVNHAVKDHNGRIFLPGSGWLN